MSSVADICRAAARAAPAVASLTTEIKDQALHSMAEALEQNSQILQIGRAHV